MMHGHMNIKLNTEFINITAIMSDKLQQVQCTSLSFPYWNDITSWTTANKTHLNPLINSCNT